MFLILTPLLYIVLIYVIAAVLPAVILMRYVDSQPTLHRQPRALLQHLTYAGMLSAIIAGFLEWIGESLLNAFHITSISVLAYLVVGVIEEGSKFWSMRRNTWNSPYFETRFDGIVYAVWVSLGFAIFENIKYVFSYGLTVAPSRALLAIPAHTAFAVLMGYFYGRAKYQDDTGNHTGANILCAIGYIAAVLLHGTYDYCCMAAGSIPSWVFLLVVILIYIIIFVLIRHEAKQDQIV